MWDSTLNRTNKMERPVPTKVRLKARVTNKRQSLEDDSSQRNVDRLLVCLLLVLRPVFR